MNNKITREKNTRRFTDIKITVLTMMTFFLSLLLMSCGGGGESTPKVADTPTLIPDSSNNTDNTDNSPLAFKSKANALGLSHQWQLIDIEQLSDFDLIANPIIESTFDTSGGIALGDYNQDGLIDIFITAGNKEASKLFQQQNDGSYLDVAQQAGVQLTGVYSGPSFADTDNDGDLDLFIGGMGYTKSKLFINQGDGTFEEGIAPNITQEFTTSSSFGDINNDGYLDLALSHYGSRPQEDTEHLWLNNTNNFFQSISIDSGITNSKLDTNNGNRDFDYSFTPSFGDLNNDGLIDFLMASDYFNSVYFINQDGLNFTNNTAQLNISKDDLHGMGATLADIDNDGDLDWFVTNIIQYQKERGSLKYSGNKLFQNNGDGSFTDISYASNIYNGGWGWASCIADFNNDGLLDIFNTNGWNMASDADDKYESHDNDTIKLFLATKSGKFTENNVDLGLKNTGQGRSAVCFDKDDDGDIDILLLNHDQESNGLIFYENTMKMNNYLNIDLKAQTKNIFAIGARVYVTALINGEEVVQMREVNINSNFTSQNPSQLHFGLGEATEISKINIVWPNGQEENLMNVAVNQSMKIIQK